MLKICKTCEKELKLYNKKIIENQLYENNDNELRLVGWLGEFECYLDIHLEPWQILLSWDKSTSRDIKLNNILSEYNRTVMDKANDWEDIVKDLFVKEITK